MNYIIKSLLALLFSAFISHQTNAQGTTEAPVEKSAFAKGLDQVTLQKGKRLFQEFDYRGSLAVYEEMYQQDMKNPLINYRIGQCYYMLRDYSSALKMFEASVEKKPNIDEDAGFYYGRTLHRLGNLDKAKTEVTRYRNLLLADKKYQNSESIKAYNGLYTEGIYQGTLPPVDKEMSKNEKNEIKLETKKIKTEIKNSKSTSTLDNLKNNKYTDGNYNYDDLEDATMELADINYALEQMTQPQDVVITNMGVDINSAFDDYGPSISADGKTLYFTARRPDTRGGEKDIYDGKYYEDIYVSKWDESAKKWSTSASILGRLNSEYHDACLGVSPDGQYFYIYKNFGENGSGEIFESKLSSSDKWGSPKQLDENINTSFWESSASLTADGKKMFFVSERKGGVGMGDIWVSERMSKSEWGIPVNIGVNINTPEDEKMVAVHPEGNMIFFASEGHLGLGGYDIYMSEFKNGEWQKPSNLGSPINTVDDDVNFSLTTDLKTAYYSGFNKESLGEKDIYEIDVTNHELIKKIREMYFTLSATIVDGTSGEGMKGTSKVTITDENGVLIKEFKVGVDEGFNTKIERNKKIKITIKSSGYKESTQIVLVEDKNKIEEKIDFKMGR